MVSLDGMELNILRIFYYMIANGITSSFSVINILLSHILNKC